MNPKDFDPGPLAQVQYHRDGSRHTLVFVKDLRQPPPRVWAALTRPEHLVRWAPFEPDRDLSTPGPATLRMTDGLTTEVHAGKVIRAMEPDLLEYTWGDGILLWVLEAHGEGTRLTLRHTTENPDNVSRTAAGWHLCLVVAERMLDGAPIPPIVGREAMKYGWDTLNTAYATRLGIAGRGWPE